jgi:hypothetical protein
VDRLANLERQANAWSGVLSVAVLAYRRSASIEEQEKRLQEMFDRVERSAKCRLDISFIIDEEVCICLTKFDVSRDRLKTYIQSIHCEILR